MAGTSPAMTQKTYSRHQDAGAAGAPPLQFLVRACPSASGSLRPISIFTMPASIAANSAPARRSSSPRSLVWVAKAGLVT